VAARRTEGPQGLDAIGGTLSTLGLLLSALVVGIGLAGAAYGSLPALAASLSVVSAYLVVAALRLTGPGATAGVLLSAVVVGAAVAGVSYDVAPLLLLGLPVATVLLVLAVLRPVAAVCASVLVAVAESVQVPLGGLGALSATEVVFLLVAVGWVWRALTGDPTVRFVQIADYPLVLLVLALLPGLALGVEPALVLRLTVLWGAFFLVFLTVKGFDVRELRWVVTALALGSGLISTAALVTYALAGGVVVQGTAVTGRASFGIPDPNYFAAYVLVAAVPALGLLVAGQARLRLATAAAVGVSGLAIALSFSRGALLGAFVAAGVVLLSRARTRATSAVVVAVLVAAAAANVNPVLDSRVTEVVADRLASATDRSSTNNRLLLWERSVEFVQDEPLGTGALGFREVAVAGGITERGRPLENAHNAYVNVAVELGLVGLLAYLLWLARVAWDVTAEWQRRRPETRGLVVGVGAAFLGFAVQGLTLTQYRVQTILATMFVLTGVAAAARAWPGPEDGPDADAPSAAADQLAPGLPGRGA
jgi:putative inorganic carbon (hco3(-)) transporter